MRVSVASEDHTEERSDGEPSLDWIVRARLSGDGYHNALKSWDKALDRLEGGDLDGAITAAKSLLEATCKAVLDRLHMQVPTGADLPKLYSLAAVAVGVSPNVDTREALKGAFRSVQTAIQSVAELRNTLGDAHGKREDEFAPLHALTELAVNLAGSCAAFLALSLTHWLAAKHKLTAAGEVVLRFDKVSVWRLYDHARNSPRIAKGYWDERRAKRALVLVGDSGIYLMSNGEPPMMDDGRVMRGKNTKRQLRFTAMAEGCGVADDMTAWWHLHNAIAEGSDFAHALVLSDFAKPLEEADRQIVIIANSDRYSVLSDREWERTKPTASVA